MVNSSAEIREIIKAEAALFRGQDKIAVAAYGTFGFGLGRGIYTGWIDVPSLLAGKNEDVELPWFAQKSIASLVTAGQASVTF